MTSQIDFSKGSSTKNPAYSIELTSSLRIFFELFEIYPD